MEKVNGCRKWNACTTEILNAQRMGGLGYEGLLMENGKPVYDLRNEGESEVYGSI